VERETALELVRAELEHAEEQHSSLFTAREGWAVIQEELDELKCEVRLGHGTEHRGVTEAVQVAAAAVRYLVDLCDDETVAEHEAKKEKWVQQREWRRQRIDDLLQRGETRPVYSGGGGYSG